MAWAKQRRGHNDARFLMMFLLFGILFLSITMPSVKAKNAYATMMYVGTPRDYEFYIAIRVLLKSLARLNVEADLVVIASIDVPNRWVRALLWVRVKYERSVQRWFQGMDGRSDSFVFCSYLFMGVGKH